MIKLTADETTRGVKGERVRKGVAFKGKIEPLWDFKRWAFWEICEGGGETDGKRGIGLKKEIVDREREGRFSTQKGQQAISLLDLLLLFLFLSVELLRRALSFLVLVMSLFPNVQGRGESFLLLCFVG